MSSDNQGKGAGNGRVQSRGQAYPNTQALPRGQIQRRIGQMQGQMQDPSPAQAPQNMQGRPETQTRRQRRAQDQSQMQHPGQNLPQGLYPPQSHYNPLRRYHAQNMMQYHDEMQHQGQFMPWQQGWPQSYCHPQRRSHDEEFQNYLSTRPSWQADNTYQGQYSHMAGPAQYQWQQHGPNKYHNDSAPAQGQIQSPTRYSPSVPPPHLGQGQYRQGNRQEYVSLPTPLRDHGAQERGEQEQAQQEPDVEESGGQSHASSETYLNISTPPRSRRVLEGEGYAQARPTTPSPQGQDQAGGLWVSPQIIRQLESQARSRQGQPECWFHANNWSHNANTDYGAARCLKVAALEGGVCEACYYFYTLNSLNQAELALALTANGGWGHEDNLRNAQAEPHVPNPEAAPFRPEVDYYVDTDWVIELDEDNIP